jgi:NAD(P)-dependent dehydrogenase (short-subunit alcohol dehydrogenase family)
MQGFDSSPADGDGEDERVDISLDTSAVVTGGAQGLGYEVARILAERGSKVTVVDVNPSVAEISARLGGEVLGVVGDVGDVGDASRAMEAAVEHSGPVDILVNNAAHPTWSALDDPLDKTLSELDDAWRVGVRGAVICSKLVLPSMMKRGRGYIVNVSTEHVHNCGFPTRIDHDEQLARCPWHDNPRGPYSPAEEMAVYDATKWALNGLTFNWSKTLRPYGVQINNFCPGAFDDEGMRAYASEREGEYPGWASGLLDRTLVAAAVASLIEEKPGRSGDNVGLWCGHPTELPLPAAYALTI